MSETPVVWTSRLTTPGAGAFAVLFGLEALGRALVTAALPVQTLELTGSDEGVSTLFLLGSVAAVAMAFVVPPLVHWLGRARVCTLAILLIAAAAALFAQQELPSQVLAFVLRACGVAILYAGLSLFIMDHIRRAELGRSEPLRMLSVGLGWTLGPVAGVQIEALWGPTAPFLASGLAAALLLGYFWALRFRDLPIVRPSRHRRVARPLAHWADFLGQPRLVLAWLQAIGRGMFWASFVIYTPLYAVATGLGAEVGGLLVSIGSGFMLLMPLWGWTARRFGIRRVSLVAFPLAGLAMTAAGWLSFWPWVGAASAVSAACAMSIIDGYGNALFFRACKPSQRTAMTPIFSAQRDLANIGHAGAFAILLSLFPIQAVYITLGLVLFGLTLLATQINRRL
jgi:ACDE family multidrug resistance protein